jgi:hypothetical protein
LLLTDHLQWAGIGFALAVVYASFFEWTLHRYVMHRPVGPFRYPYQSHALIHHKIFKADHTYHLIDEKDKWTIPMAWWNGPVLVILCNVPFLIASGLTRQWGLCIGSFIAFVMYYSTYEYLHWCMHLPRKRSIERSGLFFRLNGHHILHHRYMQTNFNVVLPLADLIMGTLLLRAKVSFAQPQGESVPNLQPYDVKPSLPRRIARFIRLCLTGVRPS